MPFDREAQVDPPARVPTEIGDVRIMLLQKAGSTALDSAMVKVIVFDQNGQEFKNFTADLVPHITGPQQTTLLNILNSVRAMLVAEVLPV